MMWIVVMVPADKWWGSAENAVGARITDISQGRARFQGAVCVKSCLGDGWQCTQSLIFGHILVSTVSVEREGEKSG